MLPETETFLALAVIRGELRYCNDLYAQAEYELYIVHRTTDPDPSPVSASSRCWQEKGDETIPTAGQRR